MGGKIMFWGSASISGALFLGRVVVLPGIASWSSQKLTLFGEGWKSSGPGICQRSPASLSMPSSSVWSYTASSLMACTRGEKRQLKFGWVWWMIIFEFVKGQDINIFMKTIGDGEDNVWTPCHHTDLSSLDDRLGFDGGLEDVAAGAKLLRPDQLLTREQTEWLLQ